jgi:hypothetical protein
MAEHACIDASYVFGEVFYLHVGIRAKAPYVLGHAHVSLATQTQASNQRQSESSCRKASLSIVKKPSFQTLMYAKHRK